MMRIFSTKFIRTFGTGILIFLFLFTISGELPLILQCTPVRAAYDTTLTASEKKCFSADILFDLEMYQGVLMFVIDIVIFAMPIPTIWNLQMPIQRRLVIVGVFGIGKFLSCIIYEQAVDHTRNCILRRWFGPTTNTGIPKERLRFYLYVIDSLPFIATSLS